MTPPEIEQPPRVVVNVPEAGEPVGGRSWVPALLGASVVLAITLALGVGSNRAEEVAPILGEEVAPPTLALDPLVELRGPALGVETNVIFVFDDGLDGLLIVDPDRRVATRESAGLQRQSRRAQLDQIGDALVIGGVATRVVSLETRDETPIPDASYHLFTPTGEMWLIDISPGVQVVPFPTITKIGLDGEVLVPAMKADVRGVPSAVVGDDLLIDTSDGLFLWDPLDGVTRRLTDDGGALVLGAAGSRLAWCHHACTSVIIDDVAAGSTIEIALDERLGAIDHTTAAWSPDGAEIVVVTTEAVIRLSDIGGSSEVTVLIEYAIGAGAPRFVAWDPSGEYVYFVTDSPRGRLTGLWRSDGTRLGTGTTTLPFSGASGPFVVLDARQASWLVGDALVAYDECPAPVDVQLPDARVCSFRF